MRRVQREEWYREALSPGERDLQDMESKPTRWVENMAFNNILPLLVNLMKDLKGIFGGDTPGFRKVQYSFEAFVKELENFFQDQGMPPEGIFRRRSPEETKEEKRKEREQKQKGI